MMQRQVGAMDLDVYEHVHNAVYFNYTEEAATQALAAPGFSPAKLSEANLTVATRRVHIQYLLPATWGEMLNISTQRLEVKDTSGSHYIDISRKDGTSVAECIMDWELVDGKSGEARFLPDELR